MVFFNFWSRARSTAPPPGLKWRSSYWFVTFVVGLGIAVDFLVYSIIIPVLPFHLEQQGYSNVSSLTGWLLFAYSGGLVISTIPIAMFSERYNSRQWPLIIGIFILIGSQIMMMEAPVYWLMCLARVLQGIGSTMVWVVGMALLCDSTPIELVGRQLGVAMAGLTLGFVIGPAVGGVLYSRFGYRGPFIMGIIGAFIDLISRLLVIERKDALHWKHDPAATTKPNAPDTAEKDDSQVVNAPGDSTVVRSTKKRESEEEPMSPEPAIPSTEAQPPGPAVPPAEIHPAPVNLVKPLTLVEVLSTLRRSSRAVVTFILTFIYGLVYTCQEPTIPLHLAEIWGLHSDRIGLVFLAAVVATIFSTPMSGWLSDRYGPEWITPVSLILSLPWWGILIIEGHLALFIVSLAVEFFFVSGVVSPLVAELAAVSRGIEGIGYAHVYGAFNIAYGIGNTVGPIIGGQIYDHVGRGWMIICLLAMGLVVFCLGLAVCFVGDDPLLRKLLRRLRKQRSRESPGDVGV